MAVGTEAVTVNQFYLGNCLQVLKSWPDNFIHMAVTSPPYYSLRDYKIGMAVWDEEGPCEHEWTDYVRPGKGGGHTGIVHRRSISPYSSVDATVHGFCSKCPAWRGQLGLEPTLEMYIRHLVQIFREVRRCLRQDGTLWVNIGDSYAGSGKGWATSEYKDVLPKFKLGENGIKEKDLMGVPWALAFALRADGWYLRSEILWFKENCVPESVKDRPTRAHEQIFLLAKTKSYFYDLDAIREKNKGEQREVPITENGSGTYQVLGKNKRTIWRIMAGTFNKYGAGTRTPGGVTHHAAFPEELIEPCIQAGTCEAGVCFDCGAPMKRKVTVVEGATDEPGIDDDIMDEAPADEPTLSLGWVRGCACPTDKTRPAVVLDMFMGTGTTAIVARKNGRDFLGIDASPNFIDSARARVEHTRVQDDI